MNDRHATCDVCDDPASPREWLRCMLCGRCYRFGTAWARTPRDCGAVLPNPQSENGC